MKEVKGNIWDYYDKQGYWVVIPTNGFVKKTGEAVMGRGLALQAKEKVKGLSYILGDKIREYGNHVFIIGDGIVSFPVKHNWYENADLKLIEQSALELKELMKVKNFKPGIVMPKVGCGNGRLYWGYVKPILRQYLDDLVTIVNY